jgi:two-component system response regulator AtoC
VPDVEPAAITMLVEYHWPGNVRELKNVLQRLLFASERVITAESVERTLGGSARGQEAGGGVALRFGDAVIPWRQMERTLREKYFRFVRMNSASDAEAAKKLGLAPPNYHRMCKELGIK